MRTRGVHVIALSLTTAIIVHASSARPDLAPSGGGLTSAPASVADSLPGVPIPCNDVRTGTPFEFRAQRLLIAGLVDTSWAPDSTRLCLGSLAGLRQRMVSDESGGAFVGWVDNRTGDGDIYLQRFTAERAIAPGWPADGLAVCGERLSQYHLDLASDGAGGVWLTWEDYRAARDGDIFVQRIGASGEPVAGWPAGGFPVCAREGQQSNPRIVADGAGGALVVWEDRRNGGVELYAQRMSSVAVSAGGWPAEGAALGSGPAVAPVLATDSLARAIVLWKALAAPGLVELRGARVPAEGPAGSWPPASHTLSSGANELGEIAVSRLGVDLVVAWAEWRGPEGSVRAQRLSITGDLGAQWSEGGAIAHAGAPGRGAPAVIGCAGGTTVIAWEDFRGAGEGDLYAQRLDAAGDIAEAWTSGGVALCLAAGEQYAPELVSDGPGAVLATWSDGASGTTASLLAATRLARMAPRLVSARAAPGHVRVRWESGSGGGGGLAYRAERRPAEGEWSVLGALALDDSARLTLDDRAVADGATLEYRLVASLGEAELFSDPVRVVVPRAPAELALHWARAVASRHGIQVSFGLPRGTPPRIELLDVAGRRIQSGVLEGLEPGDHEVWVPVSGRLASGVYFLRLLQGSRARVAKLVYVR